MTCYACDNEPTQQCPRCGRPYCDEHGEDFCGVCLEPASGVPSFNLYRGSLLALVIGAVVALWLIIQPTNGESSSGSKLVVVNATPSPAAARTLTPVRTTTAPGTATSATPGAALATVAPVTSPVGTSFAGTQTPRAGTPGAGTPSPSAGGGTYTVVSGDTLSSICSIQKPSQASADCVAAIKSANGLSSDSINIGQTLKLP